jgi:hypothetical protein
MRIDRQDANAPRVENTPRGLWEKLRQIIHRLIPEISKRSRRQATRLKGIIQIESILGVFSSLGVLGVLAVNPR